MSDKDTDFAQFEDMAEFRDAHAEVAVKPDAMDCPREDCASIFLLERRVDRHREEIEELKKMVAANGAQTEKYGKSTDEILEIITTAKAFFKVLGWLGEKLKPIAVIVMTLAGITAAIFASGAKWGKP